VRVGCMEAIARRGCGGEFAGEEGSGRRGRDRAASGRTLFCFVGCAGAWWGPPLVGANERACAPMFDVMWQSVERSFSEEMIIFHKNSLLIPDIFALFT
jgi:hypothetical protein